MVSDSSLRRYRNWYGKLIRLYPKRFREQFGEGLEQTFHDLCRERVDEGGELFSLVLWVSCETAAEIVRENMSMAKKNKSIVRILLATLLILMVPLVAMQFTNEVNWDTFDFVVAAVLLIGSGLAFEFTARKCRHLAYRIGVGLAVFTGLLLVWINLAVGLIGNENHPANLMYFAVVVLGFAGAIFSRFQPLGMSRALCATAVFQTMVPIIAILIWQPPLTLGVLKVFVLSTVFAALFGWSAFLFRHASRQATAVQPST